MRRCAPAPTVAFLGGEGFAVVALDVAGLGLAVPEVVALEQGVERAEVLKGGFAVRELHRVGFFLL